MPRTRLARRIVAACTAGALALSLAACSSDEPVELDLPSQADVALPGATQERLQAAVEHAMAASGAPGAIVGVWVPWAGRWVAGLGTTTPGGRPVTDDLTFGAGAITRAMTCDALYRVAEQGRVSLDDSITKYVSGLPGYEAVTLGELCDSTSGLGNYAGKLSERWLAYPERVWNPRELLAYGMAGDLAFDPGSRYRGSDTGYLLLGLALERATGLSAADLLADDVFTPLGLPDTSLPAVAASGRGHLPGLRSPNTDGEVDCAAPTDLTAMSPTTGFTASGVVSDVTDLGRYVQSLAVGARSYDAPERFAEPYPLTTEDPSWFTARGGAFQAGSLVGQFGSVPGYLTAAFADRVNGMTVVVVLNNSRASAHLVRLLAWELAAIASKAPAAPGQSAPEAGLPWTAESVAAELDEYAVCPAS